MQQLNLRNLSSACHREMFTKPLSTSALEERRALLPNGVSEELMCASYVDIRAGGVCAKDDGAPAVRFFTDDDGWGYYMQLALLVGGVGGCGRGSGSSKRRLPPVVFVRLDHPDVGSFVREVVKGDVERATASQTPGTTTRTTTTTTTTTTTRKTTTTITTTTTATTTTNTTTTTTVTTTATTTTTTTTTTTSTASPTTSGTATTTFVSPATPPSNDIGQTEKSVADRRTKLPAAEVADLIHSAIEGGSMDSLRTLLEAGADPNAVSNATTGRTPLHSACLFNRTEMVELLLEQSGVRPDVSDASGFRPIHYCATFGHVAATDALISAGANVNGRVKKYVLSVPSSRYLLHLFKVVGML